MQPLNRIRSYSAAGRSGNSRRQPLLNPNPVLRYDPPEYPVEDPNFAGDSLPSDPTSEAPSTGSAHPVEGENMDVTRINSPVVNLTAGTNSVRPAASSATGGTQSVEGQTWQPVRDEVQISATGRMIDQVNHDPQARAERLAALKEAIDSGVYDTADKLDRAMERMLDSVLHSGS